MKHNRTFAFTARIIGFIHGIHPRAAKDTRLAKPVRAVLLLLSLSPTLGAQPLSPPPIQEIDHIVAIVNDDVIVASELNTQMRMLLAELRQAGNSMPSPAMLKKRVLERAILELLQIQVAERAGIRIEEEQLNQAIADIARKNGLELDQFRGILERNGYSFATFRQNIRRQLMITEIQKRRVANRVQVTDREIDNYLARAGTDPQGQKRHIVVQTKARHILVRTDEMTSDTDAETQLGRIRERIIQGEDFRELAQAHSDDRATALDGGDLGWIDSGDVVPQFAREMNKLQPMETSQPFRTQFGWHIAQVLDRRKLDGTQAARRARARREIQARRIDEELEVWLRQLRDEAYVEYRLEEQ